MKAFLWLASTALLQLLSCSATSATATYSSQACRNNLDHGSMILQEVIVDFTADVNGKPYYAGDIPINLPGGIGWIRGKRKHALRGYTGNDAMLMQYSTSTNTSSTSSGNDSSKLALIITEDHDFRNPQIDHHSPGGLLRFNFKQAAHQIHSVQMRLPRPDTNLNGMVLNDQIVAKTLQGDELIANIVAPTTAVDGVDNNNNNMMMMDVTVRFDDSWMDIYMLRVDLAGPGAVLSVNMTTCTPCPDGQTLASDPTECLASIPTTTIPSASEPTTPASGTVAVPTAPPTTITPTPVNLTGWQQIGGVMPGTRHKLSADGNSAVVITGLTSARVYRKSHHDQWRPLGQEIMVEAPTLLGISDGGNIVSVGNGNTAQIYHYIDATETWKPKLMPDGIQSEFVASDFTMSGEGSVLVLFRGDGVIRIYGMGGTTLSELDAITWPNLGQGLSLDLSSDGTTLVVGDPFADPTSGTGAVEVFRRDPVSLKYNRVGQKICQNASTETSFSCRGAGWMVSATQDGNMLATSTFVSSESAVTVYKYDGERTGSEWVQVGDPILPYGIDQEGAARIVLSDDGSTVGIIRGIDFFEDVLLVYRLDSVSQQWTRVGDPLKVEIGTRQAGMISLSADGSVVSASSFSRVSSYVRAWQYFE